MRLDPSQTLLEPNNQRQRPTRLNHEPNQNACLPIKSGEASKARETTPKEEEGRAGTIRPRKANARPILVSEEK